MSKRFDQVWQDTTTEIEFNHNWSNGTGYFDNAVKGKHAPSLEVGQIVKAKSPMPDNRRLIMIGTPVGNVVIFERFSDDKYGVIVGNLPDRLNTLYGLSGAMREETIEFFLGAVHEGEAFNNIGHRLAGWTYQSPKKKQKD